MAGDNITLSPSVATDAITITSHDMTYTLTQDVADGHTFTLTSSEGDATSITIPDNNTTYTISASGNNIVLTPSNGAAQTLRVPYATVAGTAETMDAANLTGTIDIERLPASALERVLNVTDDEARFALTTDDIQLGDTVKVASTNLMYMVKDVDHLDSEDGYE